MIINGHVLEVLRGMKAESVNCVITSPPYWGLRDYGLPAIVWDDPGDCRHEWDIKTRKGISGGTKSQKVQIKDKDNFQIVPDSESAFCIHCNAWRGQLGLEPTFELYLQHLWQIFDEVKRVLRKDGCCFVNLGDSYGGNQGRGSGKGNEHPQKIPQRQDTLAKSLCLIPQRFAIGMVDRGWICRNELIWWKPNCMPSSAKDRFTVDFEPVFFFVKNRKYWFETQYENANPLTQRSKPVNATEAHGNTSNGDRRINYEKNRHIVHERNKRCVWKVTTQPFKEAHFATFPEALVEPMIKSGCPEFVCSECGKAREKVIEDTGRVNHQRGYGSKTAVHIGVSPTSSLLTKAVKEKEFKGYTDCGCNAPFNPGIVLDIFAGAGTVGVVAKKLHRKFVGIELNPAYAKMAEERIASAGREEQYLMEKEGQIKLL